MKAGAGGTTAERQLGVLRELLARDYLASPDFTSALKDLACMVKAAVDAQEALVALWHADAEQWEVVTTEGTRLRGESIRKVATRSVLDRVRETGKPEFTTGDRALNPRSESVHGAGIEGVLVTPLSTWDVAEEPPVLRFRGCLYAHRTAARVPFADDDVALVTDIARIAQPTLSLLSHLRRVEMDLEASKAELQDLRRKTGRGAALGAFSTKEPHVARHVIGPLERASTVDKVGILFLGPTGAGKTHLAEAYHRACPRRERPFIVLNCGAFRSASILAPELFGFAADSGYANAPRRGRPGKALLADGGTLFLDEIGCLPLELQPQLLRLVDQGLYTALGDSREVSVDVQVLGATNQDLLHQVREGSFREDLYWRLADVVIALPPLTERLLDIPDLAADLLRRALEKTRRADIRGFHADALASLQGFDWSLCANVRGLGKTIERSVILAPPRTSLLRRRHLHLPRLGAPSSSPGASAVEPADRSPAPTMAERRRRDLERIRAAIKSHGRATDAARALGISYRELYWRLQRAGLSVHRILLDEEG